MANKGKIKNLEPDFEKTERSAVSWASAFYIGLYSYDGWYAINNGNIIQYILILNDIYLYSIYFCY